MKISLSILFICLATFNLLIINGGIHKNSIRDSIDHFRFHQEGNNEISVTSFLLIHYCPFSGHENQSDAQLPALLKHLGMYFFETNSFLFDVLPNIIPNNFSTFIENYFFQFDFEVFNPPQ